MRISDWSSDVCSSDLRQAAVDPRAALGDPCGLLAIGAEPVFGHVHDLGPRLRVLKLRDVDVLGADARHVIGCLRRDAGGRAAALQIKRWRKDLERSGGPGANRSEEHTSELQSLMRISYA